MSMSRQPLFRFTHSLQDLERRFEVEEEYIALGKSIRSREFYQELKDRNIRY